MTRLIRRWQLGLCLIMSSLGFAYASDSNIEQQAQFSDAELAQMLAPIALYPDSLLTHILIAATYPLEIVEADRLAKKHPDLAADKLMAKAEDEDWDPSVTALLAFPSVLERLSEDLNWTQDLGDAFLQDEADVLASIQDLRKQADEAENLEQMDNMTVTKVNNQIIIEPSEPQVIYVPYYDPRVVYGYWRWHAYPPIYWHYPRHYVHYRHGHFYWHSRTHISFNFYFSAFHWHKRHVVVTHHRKSHKYRHHGRIVTSKGAQRWHHKPQHRRGVAYRSPVVKQRYNSHKPAKFYNQQPRVKHSNMSHAANNKALSKPQQRLKREQDFSHKMQQNKAAKPVNVASNNHKHSSAKISQQPTKQQPKLNNNQRHYGTNKSTNQQARTKVNGNSHYSNKASSNQQNRATSQQRQYLPQAPNNRVQRQSTSQSKAAKPARSQPSTRPATRSHSNQKSRQN